MTRKLTPDQQSAIYRDPQRTVTERVEDLLGRMTLAEKIAQLGSAWVYEFTTDSEFDTAKAAELCAEGLGQVTRISGASGYTAGAAAHIANRIQQHLADNTRLGIPAIVHEEICSGVMARGSVVYPQAIGVASTFDPELNREMAAELRIQMRAIGVHQGLSPDLDVSRDPRWGRTEETYGEDPYLVAAMGTAFVDGLQNGDLADGVAATAKHFVGYAMSEGGLNWAPAHIPDRELREVYLHPFEAAVREAGLKSVMNGYHELDGIPCAANGKLMNDMLRDEWGFDGIVVSDYHSIDQLAAYHRLAEDKVEAATIAINSGIDVELPFSNCYAGALQVAVEKQMVSPATLDEAVRRTLKLKFELGLFERSLVDEAAATVAARTERQRLVAAGIARKSMVLLRNDGILPLDKAPGTIAVIGPNAHDSRNLLGDYCYQTHIEALLELSTENNVFAMPIPDDTDAFDLGLDHPTVLDAIQSRYGDAVRYARGCGIADDDRSGFAEAVKVAATADVAILVVGDKAGLTEDCTSGETRDRSSLHLPGVQEELAAAVIATGTPVITVLIVGRPCGSEALHQQSAALLVAWLPGEEGGAAIADVLSGDCNPGGRLPITFPRTVGQIPVFYGHKVSGGRSHWRGDYVDDPSTPMYPFGFGLTYSDFEYTRVGLDRKEGSTADTIVVLAEITNTSKRDGDEVVQLYVSDPRASVTRPLRELKAFVRVSITAGTTRTVRFEVPVAQLGFYDRDLVYVVEPGEIEVLVGRSAHDLHSAGSFDVVGDTKAHAVSKKFSGSVSVT